MGKTFAILIFLFTAVLAHAQEVTGVWQGHFRSANFSSRSALADEVRYKFEVQIAQNGKTFEGVTYSYLSTLFYGKAAAKGTVNIKNGKVLLQEGKLLEFRDMMGGGVCIMTCFLQYTKSGDEEFLEGTYISMNVQDSSNCGRGTVFLRKVANSDFYKEPIVAKREAELAHPERPKSSSPKPGTVNAPGLHPATPESKPAPPVAKTTPKSAPAKPVLPKTGSSGHPATASSAKPGAAPSVKPAPPLSKLSSAGQLRIATTHEKDSTGNPARKFATITPEVLRSRSNQLVKTITVNTNEIILNIYDDGAIDHDTISVYLDNRLILSHRMLTDRAIVLKIHMDPSEAYHELVMVAENEGDIPPNTSLMIVKAGDKQYEVRITSTEQKNAVIVFKYEAPAE